MDAIKLVHLATDNTQRTIAKTFELMGIAEEELEKAGLQNKTRGTTAFLVLQPAGPFLDVVSQVYRLHARELCNRMARTLTGAKGLAPGTRVDLSEPTDMEVLLALSAASLKAPLNAPAQAIAHRFFAQVEGNWANEPLDLSTLEYLDGYRQRCRVPNRILKEVNHEA